MRVTSIRYSRLKNLGDYEHEKIGVEVEVAEGESSAEAMARASKFVDAALAKPDMPSAARIEMAQHCVENYETLNERGVVQDGYQRQEYEDAKRIIALAEAAAKPFEEF